MAVRLHDLVENRLAPKVSQVAGVGTVALSGGQRPAVRIQVNPNALATARLSLEDVRAAGRTAWFQAYLPGDNARIAELETELQTVKAGSRLSTT